MVIGCQPLTGESMRWLKDTVSGLSNPHDAAARNRVSKMRKYVQQGGDVNKQNKLGDTPMHEACAYIRDNGDSSKGRRRKGIVKGRRKVGKRFAQQGGIDAQDGPIEMLDLLVSSGSDINAQNIVGDAPLHKAALNGRALAADFLIRAGANVNIRNEFAQTPLHAACVSGSMEIVQQLVQGGADTSAQDAAEDTPFHEACRHQYESIVIYLMRLVNNPESSEGLKLWRGLDPSWEKILRSSAQARIKNAEGRAKRPTAAGTADAATVAGSSPAAMYLNTPSTVHNSLQSAESERVRTPSESKFGGSHKETDGGGGPTANVNCEAIGSVRPSQTLSMSPPKGAVANGAHRDTTQAVGSGEGGEARALNNENNGRSRLQSKPRRQELLIGAPTELKKGPRSFSALPSEVLDWQATKAKNVQQGKVIEKAREALREEQQEEALGLSSTTRGDEDSVDGKVEVIVRDKVGDGSESAKLCSATSTMPDKHSKEMRKTPPSADGRTTPQTCMIRDVSVSSPTREGVRRKTKSVVVLPSPRARVLRRSTAFPVSEKMHSLKNGGGAGGGGSGRGERSSGADESGGGERTSRRRPPYVPVSETKSRSHAGSRASNAPPEKGRRRSSSSGSRREEELIVGGGDAGGGRTGKSHHRSNCSSSSGHRHKERDAAARSPGRRRKEDRSRSGRDKAGGVAGGEERRHRSRGQKSHRHGGEGRGLEESRTASLKGTKEHRTVSASARGVCVGNGGSISSKCDGSKRELKRLSRHVEDEMSAEGGETTSAMKALEEAPKVPRKVLTPRARGGGLLLGKKQDSSYKTPSKEETKSAEAYANEETWVKRPMRRSGSSQELVPPTWASELDSGLDKVLPLKKKVVESPLPVRRNSPYLPYRISSPSPRLKGAVAELGSASKKKGVFFPIRTVPVPSMPSPASLQKKREDALLKAAADSYASVGSSGPTDVSGLQKKQDVVIKVVASDSSASGDVKSSVADSCEVGAGAGERGTAARVAAVKPVPRRPRNVGEGPEAGLVSRADTLDDGPPNMEALQCVCPPAEDKPSGSVGVEVVLIGKGGVPVKMTSWLSPDEIKLRHAVAARPAEIVVFSDSETDNDRSSSARYTSRASHTFGDFGTVTPLAPAPTKSVSDADSNEPEPVTTSAPDLASDETASTFQSGAGTTLSDEDVERAMEKSADGAASSLVFHGSFGSASSPGSVQRVAVTAAVAASNVVALPPAPLSIPPSEKSESANGNVSGCGESDAGSISSSRAWVAGARAAAAEAQAEAEAEVGRNEGSQVVVPAADDGGLGTPSVIGKESSSANPSLVVGPSVIPSSNVAIPEAASGTRAEDEKKTDGSTVSVLPPSPKLPVRTAAPRKRLTLGRRDRPSVKVTMPIVGGKAAWEKFLADAGVNEDDDAAESAFHGDEGSGDKPGVGDDEEKGQEGDEGTTAESAEASDDSAEEDDALNERMPRGFKDPVQVEGPSKGPAAAFSGNAMWRLAGGASGAANRARSGVELNGNGGFSNPLSAMRAADSRTSQAGTGARGGMLPNPLAGVRGAMGMSNAGIANPLARGRGALYGTTGVVNPLVGGGGGRAATTNPLARRSNGAGIAKATTQGEDRDGPSKGLSASTLGGSRRTSAPTVIRTAEASLRVSHFSPDYSSAFVSASAGLSSAGGDDFADDVPGAMGFDGAKGVESMGKSVLPPAPHRRRARSSLDNELPHEADRDPGRTKVASVVMAFQKPADHRAGLVIADPHQVDEVSTVAEQGLVQLRRVNWSPHPSQREKTNVV